MVQPVDEPKDGDEDIDSGARAGRTTILPPETLGIAIQATKLRISDAQIKRGSAAPSVGTNIEKVLSRETALANVLTYLGSIDISGTMEMIIECAKREQLNEGQLSAMLHTFFQAFIECLLYHLEYATKEAEINRVGDDLAFAMASKLKKTYAKVHIKEIINKLKDTQNIFTTKAREGGDFHAIKFGDNIRNRPSSP